MSWYIDDFDDDILRLFRRLTRRFSDRTSDLDRFFGESFDRSFEDFGRNLLEPPKGEGWNVRRIDEPGVKGYIAERRVVIRGDGDQSVGEGWRPRIFRGRRRAEDLPSLEPETRKPSSLEPLVDVREDLDRVSLYVLLPGVKREDVKVNVSKEAVEVVVGDLKRSVSLPSNALPDKVTKKFRGNALIVVIPKSNEKPSDSDQKPSAEDATGTV